MQQLIRHISLKRKSLGFDELKAEVIDPGFCTRCGACVAFCKNLGFNGQPKKISECVLDEGALECSKNGTCYDHCPVTTALSSEDVFGERGDESLGFYRKVVPLRATKEAILQKAQDGGAVTSILCAALESGRIEGVLAVDKDERWRSIPKVVTSIEDLINAAGTKYWASHTVQNLGKTIRELKLRKIAIVGTPCQINGVRKLQKGLLNVKQLEIITVGLFCMEAFSYEKLVEYFGSRLDLKKVKKMDIKKGKFLIESTEKIEIPLSEVRRFVPEHCLVCTDFSAELADISVGSVGTPAGWSTAIVRSQVGEELLKNAIEKGYVQIEEAVSFGPVKKLVINKRDRATDEIKRRKNEKLPLPPKAVK